MQSTTCRFSSCSWTGKINYLFEHCETYHVKFIKEVGKDKAFSFSLDEVSKDTFLLNGEGGLYWFLLVETDGGIRRGVFYIGDSDICNYTLKIGSISDGYVVQYNPRQTQADTSGNYEFNWTYLDFAVLNEQIPSKCVKIYFGEYNDKDIYTGTYQDVDWCDPKEVEYNEKCLEQFTCFVCFEFIRRNARFCENRHYLCSGCLKKLIDRKMINCPMCRGDFDYDCVDEDIEKLLRCVKFPKTE